MNDIQQLSRFCVGFCIEYFNELASAEECIQYCAEYISKENIHALQERGYIEGYFISPTILKCILVAIPLSYVYVNGRYAQTIKNSKILNACNRLYGYGTVGCVIALGLFYFKFL